MQKEAQILETKKQVMAFKLQIKAQHKQDEKARLLENRQRRRRARNNDEQEFQLSEDDALNLSENEEEEFNMEQPVG